MLPFGAGDTAYNESYAAHFNQPRISGLFRDLNPAAGGSVIWQQLADRIAVTWLRVPEYGKPPRQFASGRDPDCWTRPRAARSKPDCAPT